MLSISWDRLLEAYLVLLVALYAVAYAFASEVSTYVGLTATLSIIFISLAWLLVSISIGKYLLSCVISSVRAAVRVPFRLIRSVPSTIRLVFFDAPLVVLFFIWFRILVFFDRHFLRRVLYWAGGLKHPSGIRISSVNAIAPSFRPLSQLSDSRSIEFDLKTAISLANLSKLAYEDEGIVEYELREAGFDMSCFQVIKYHNTSGYISVRHGIVVIAFRGTEPLNLMHIMTDLQGGLVSLSSLDNEEDEVDAGKAHYGFLEALRLHRKDSPHEKANENVRKTETISLDEEDLVGSLFTALFKVGGFFFRSVARQPLALKIPKPNGKITAFEQISQSLGRIQKNTEIRRIFCTGHSLGGALATMFFAQAQLSTLDKELVRNMIIYTFGAPRLGDAAFTKWMKSTGGAKRIYKIVNAQDLVPRMPTLPEKLPKSLRKYPYAESPGILVHLNPIANSISAPEEALGLKIDESGKVPSIVFWGLSGLLSSKTIKKIRTEKWIWVTARVWIPFLMFDHLASQYALVLQDMYEESDDWHFESQVYNAISD